MKIGVLALQGDFDRHREALARVRGEAVESVEVRKTTELDGLDGLVIPGGESTTLLKLMDAFDFWPAMEKFHAAGRPIFGTCAGAILVARDVENPQQRSLGFIDIGVERNAYGRQRESFAADIEVQGLEGGPLHAVFIRAPVIADVGAGVRVLARERGEIVLAESDRALVATFHPELTSDDRLHRRFVAKVRAARTD